MAGTASMAASVREYAERVVVSNFTTMPPWALNLRADDLLRRIMAR